MTLSDDIVVRSSLSIVKTIVLMSRLSDQYEKTWESFHSFKRTLKIMFLLYYMQSNNVVVWNMLYTNTHIYIYI